jgi:hypothetical protein
MMSETAKERRREHQTALAERYGQEADSAATQAAPVSED